MNIALHLLKPAASGLFHHKVGCLFFPLKEPGGSCLGKTVQVGVHIGTHATNTFLFLGQAVLFLDLLFEWVKSSLINFTSLSAKPAREQFLVLCSMCIVSSRTLELIWLLQGSVNPQLPMCSLLSLSGSYPISLGFSGNCLYILKKSNL